MKLQLVSKLLPQLRVVSRESSRGTSRFIPASGARNDTQGPDAGLNLVGRQKRIDSSLPGSRPSAGVRDNLARTNFRKVSLLQTPVPLTLIQGIDMRERRMVPVRPGEHELDVDDGIPFPELYVGDFPLAARFDDAVSFSRSHGEALRIIVAEPCTVIADRGHPNRAVSAVVVENISSCVDFGE